jgi:tetratricopeptide (TPR) repeat protein
MGKNENHPEMLENKVGVAGAHIHRREWTTAINVLLEVISSENTDQELPRHLQSHRQLVILEGKSFLANAYYESTKLENAKQVYEELCSDMGIPEDLLHKDHPDRLANLSGLGWVYYNLGMIKEAMSLFLEALPKQNILLGAEYPETRSSIKGLKAVSKKLDRSGEGAGLGGRILLQEIGIKVR